MVGLWITVRVSDDKRQELMQALSAFTAEEHARPRRRRILQDVNDEELVCWVGRWRTAEAREAFLQSATFRTIKGAAKVLGLLEEVSVVELSSAPNDEGLG